MRGTLRERLEAKTLRGDGCWIFQGGKDSHGYGVIGRGGRGRGALKAHRAAYELEYGPIADGVVIRHKCDNPPCIRLDHLEAGSQSDNCWDTIQRKRHASFRLTHCPHGHEYTPYNTLWKKHGRQCRICAVRVNRLRRQRKRAIGAGQVVQ